ncbi:Gfo/Idh/MocA family protein [Paracoccus alkanivorans]|uniref:Gfo/Idh/MocA family oxidoreductase n=1 Tax=Paracoccus alkanivorans TaxID=2116655 RepID=A0A3M0MBT0_9RHOB|nr:Gfo/Idh/MocA family oxidoreductase [Paracoccus alkanivorans]RMC34765.1 gfo/Idh/MocA family oxidoreductase [Paracoccus alkanivorans]
MTRTVNYGMIGCGMMGREHLRNIRLLPDTRIAAIYEPDSDMRHAAAGIAPEARLIDSVEALLDTEALDCVVIASPNLAHVGQLEQLARYRPLPVLVEKPLFTRSEDQSRLGKLMNSYPAPIWVAMEYRYMPPIARFLDRLDQATGGLKMLTIREHRFPFLHKVGAWNRFNHSSGGTLVEKCCHFFDLMRLAIRSEPVRVMASAGQAVNHRDEIYDGKTPDIWDNAYVIVDFANGARAMLELCMFAEGARYQEEISAVGPSGKIEAFVPGPGRFWPEHLGAPPIAQLIESPRAPMGPIVHEIPVDPALLAAGDHNGSTFYQHQKFKAAVLGQQPVEVTVEDGMKAVLMGLAAQESAISGSAIELDLNIRTALAEFCS